jgi:metabotropic X receptor
LFVPFEFKVVSVYDAFMFVLQAFEELEELLAKKDICIAVKEKLVKDSGVAGDHAYDHIVQKLLTKPRARG